VAAPVAGRPYRDGMTSPADPRSSDESGGPVWAEAYGGATYGRAADEPTSGAQYQIEESTGIFTPPPVSAPPPRPQAPPPPPRPEPGYGYPPPAAGPVGPVPPTAADRSDAALGHYLGAVGLAGPLVVFLVNSGRGARWLRLSLTEAINFHISVLIYSAGLSVLVGIVALVTCGLGIILFGLLVVPWALAVVYSVLGGQAASRGELYEYPVTIRFVK
jgi:uncharacterized Tic20 family protein